MKGGRVGFVLAAAGIMAGLSYSPAVLAQPSAAAQGACGAFSQPCTWNFSPLGSSGGGADVYAAQSAGHGGAGVVVAVVDSWVDASHPAFGGRVIDQVDCVGATDSNGNPAPGMCHDHTAGADACVHGTHVAGTIASSNFGVASRADVLAVRVLTASSNGDCSGNPPDVAAGILYAAQHGARVINLSLGDVLPGLGQDSNITAAVHEAAAAGALVVFASGNNGSPFTDNYGGDALLVAATGPSGQLSGYSNPGDLGAPGGDDGTSCAIVECFSGNGCDVNTCILSTLPGDQYGLLEGTSMAAPHVSGTAALLFAEHPNRTRDDVIHTLETTAHPVSGAGSGLIDAGAALALEPPSAQAAPAGSRPAATPPTATGASRAVRGSSGAVASSASGPVAPGTTGVPATTAPGSTTSAPPSISSPTTGSTGTDPSAAKRSAAGPVGLSKADDAGSIAAAGAVAALLLLVAGARTGMVAFRRKQT